MSMMTMNVPIRVEFECRLQHFANANGNWRPKAGNARKLRHQVAWNLVPLGKWRPAIPCRVVITRIAPRKFDSDNAIHACKPIRDEVAKWLGIDDRHDDRVQYVCEQQPSDPHQYWVRIEFVELSGKTTP